MYILKIVVVKYLFLLFGKWSYPSINGCVLLFFNGQPTGGKSPQWPMCDVEPNQNPSLTICNPYLL